MSTTTPPATLFIAHGSPMLALAGGAWGEALAAEGKVLPRPTALLVVSAHWETPGGFRLTSAAQPGVLHDFGGFPAELYTLDYPAPGAPDLARQAQALLTAAGLPADLDPRRPLDHGAWAPLRHLHPAADLPVVQLSLPLPRRPELLRAAGRALAPLRQQGVQVLASGGLVHNLRLLDWDLEDGPPRPWAQAFQDWVDARLATGDTGDLDRWTEAPGARESVPTSEHFDPLFVALGAAEGPAELLHRGWQLGSLSLASYRFP